MKGRECRSQDQRLWSQSLRKWLWASLTLRFLICCIGKIRAITFSATYTKPEQHRREMRWWDLSTVASGVTQKKLRDEWGSHSPSSFLITSSALHLPGTGQSMTRIWPHSVLPTSLWNGCYVYPHVTATQSMGRKCHWPGAWAIQIQTSKSGCRE